LKPVSPTLYIDHSVVTDDTCWPVLESAIKVHGLQLALSVWNVYEIGRAVDRAQRDRRLAFLHSLDPIWMIERRSVQCQEVARFLCLHHFNRSPSKVISTTPHFAQSEALRTGTPVRIGLTPRVFIDEFDYTGHEPLRDLATNAQTALRAAKPHLVKAKAKEMFCAWMDVSLPAFDPDGHRLIGIRRNAALEFCYENAKQLYTECPAMAVEDEIEIARRKPPFTKLAKSDAADMNHAIIALAYADIFLTRNKTQARLAEAARAAISSPQLAKVCLETRRLEVLLSET
jgi:hypothetical protein